MNEQDTKAYLPVHVILGAAEYTKIKAWELEKIGELGELVAKHTAIGWVIMAAFVEQRYNHMMSIRSTEANCAQLCSFGVIGLKEVAN